MAGRVVGFAYLSAMATSILSESVIRGRMVVADDVLATAANIAANKGLFRVAIALDLATLVADLALIAALTVVLAPVSRPLALFAAATRFVAVAVAGAGIARSFDVVRLLRGDEALAVFDRAQVAALVRHELGAHAATLLVAFVLLGIGSTVFGLLWLRSGTVPRAFGVLGIVGSAMLGAGSLVSLLAPPLGTRLGMAHMLPLFVFEVGLGLWLAAGRMRLPRPEPV